MAKHNRREQESQMNESRNHNMMNNANNNPFGIDPIQLLGLLGGNFDMRNMSNMLASMNTNGFNLNNLGPLAQMAGLNTDNNFNSAAASNLNNINNMNSSLNRNNNNNNNSNVQNKPLDSNLNKSEAGSQKQGDSINKFNNQKTGAQSETKNSSINTVNQEKARNTDENLEFLLMLRSFVHQSKVPFVDRIIDGYKKGLFK